MFRASWWVPSPDGNYFAAFKPDLLLYLYEADDNDEAAVSIAFPGGRDSNGVRRIFPQISAIHWHSDSQGFTGIYTTSHWYDEDPKLRNILQGIVIDASAKELMAYFYLTTDGKIEDYTVSGRGDRIAIQRDETWLELWNPLTEEHITSIEVPYLDLDGLCES